MNVFSLHCFCRARLSDLDNWRVNVEAASQHFDSLVGGLRSNWFHLEQRFDQISNRIEHRGRTPRAIDCSPYQQQVQQVVQHAHSMPHWIHVMLNTLNITRMPHWIHVMLNITRSTVMNHIVSQPTCLNLIYKLPQVAYHNNFSCKEGAQVALNH